jgi:hypothetical protein
VCRAVAAASAMAVINAVSLSELSALKERLAGIKALARDAHKLQLSEHAVRFRAHGRNK